MKDPFRYLDHHNEGTFGSDKFGQWAESFARFFGTVKFIIGQTIIVAIWVVGNAYLIPRLGSHPWDKYPFVFLNLMFSLQAAYAAPLILLAQTRQAERDKSQAEADAKHREEIADYQAKSLKENTDLTKEVHDNTEQISLISQKIDALCKKMKVPNGK